MARKKIRTRISKKTGKKQKINKRGRWQNIDKLISKSTRDVRAASKLNIAGLSAAGVGVVGGFASQVGGKVGVRLGIASAVIGIGGGIALFSAAHIKRKSSAKHARLALDQIGGGKSANTFGKMNKRITQYNIRHKKLFPELSSKKFKSAFVF